MLESAAASTPASGLGRIIDGRYRLEEKLGGGSAGSTYRAHRVEDSRLFAIKLYDDDVSADASRRSRFEWEAATLAGLGHPNVVSIVDYGVFAGRRYLVSEWLDGESLADRLRRGTLPLTAAVGITRQVLAALASAHGARLAHRNLKPSDVFLEFRKPGRERVKLLDFAPAMSSPRSPTKGARTYVPPEFAMGDPLDARSDVYAVGALLSGMLHGGPSEVPVLAGPASVADRMRRGPTVDSTLQGWIRRAMARDRFERFTDAAEMLQQLIDLLPRDLRSSPDSYDTSRVSSAVGIPSPVRNEVRRADLPRAEQVDPVFEVRVEEARPRSETETGRKRIPSASNRVRPAGESALEPEDYELRDEVRERPRRATPASSQMMPALSAAAIAAAKARQAQPAPIEPVSDVDANAPAIAHTGKRPRIRPREALEAAAAAVAAARNGKARAPERGEPPAPIAVSESQPEPPLEPLADASTAPVDTWKAAIASLAAPALPVEAKPEVDSNSQPESVHAPESSTPSAPPVQLALVMEPTPATVVPIHSEPPRKNGSKRPGKRGGRESRAERRARDTEVQARAARHAALANAVGVPPVKSLVSGSRDASHASVKPKAADSGASSKERARASARPSETPAAKTRADASKIERKRGPQLVAAAVAPRVPARVPTRPRVSLSERFAQLRAFSPGTIAAARTARESAERGLSNARELLGQGSKATAVATRAVSQRVAPVLARSPLAVAAIGFSALFALFVTLISPSHDVRAGHASLQEVAEPAPEPAVDQATGAPSAAETSLGTARTPSDPTARGANRAAGAAGSSALNGPLRVPSRNPWILPVPTELEGIPAIASSGGRGDEVLMRKLREYTRTHPQDARGALLLGRIYMNRLWRSDAVAQFAIALQRDPAARGAPEVLPALLELVVLGKASDDAQALVASAYGKSALPVIESQIRAVRSTASVARLSALRDKIAGRPPAPSETSSRAKR